MPDETLSVRNPRTGLFDYEISVTSADTVSQCTQALREAQPEWLALGAEGRAKCLDRFADALMNEIDSLAEALAIDTGRRTFARFEAFKSVELIQMWAERVTPILDQLAGSGQSG
ncbi:MAG: aldehyde dehydrogenase family protein, partial [Halieaceae bacterium]|nr:aldehyde dehydrogenase family protein [Halieaceae bacterium]